MTIRSPLLPSPAADFASLSPRITEVDREWFRIHRCIREPLYFNPEPSFRFSAPGREFGVLFAGADVSVSTMETLIIDPALRIVSEAALADRCLSRIRSSRKLRLVDLVSSGGLKRIGADSRLFSGDHAIARQWALALHEHPSRPDGIWYPSRLDPTRSCVAVFCRSRDAMESELVGPLLAAPTSSMIAAALDHYAVALI